VCACADCVAVSTNTSSPLAASTSFARVKSNAHEWYHHSPVSRLEKEIMTDPRAMANEVGKFKLLREARAALTSHTMYSVPPPCESEHTGKGHWK
jgi:hypothetical protein